MPALGLALGLGFGKMPTSGAAPSYVRTAFVASTGNNATAILNDPNLPYSTLAAASTALLVAYPGQSTTLRLKTNITENITSGSHAAKSLMLSGLTIRSHDATRRTLSGTVYLYGSANAGASDLTLSNIQVATVGETHTGATPASLGTLRVESYSVIDNLMLEGTSAGAAGANGITGSGSSGSNGTNGLDGDPPTNGDNAFDLFCSGDFGGYGEPGDAAWNLNIVCDSTGTISNLHGDGKVGGAGGNGGNGGSCIGGNGGNGGNATGTDQNGGNGGDGADVTTVGGDGGAGGNGGNGSTVTVTGAGTCTITTSVFSGGASGAGGTGGTGGAATAGTGGTGGVGSGLGSPGNNGADGTVSNGNGANGANGTAGTAGGIV